MKFLVKKNYIIFILFSVFFVQTPSLGIENKVKYSSKNISNYFLGIISSKNHYTQDAYKYLNKVKLLKNKHTQYNSEFIRTLVITEKFDEAFNFSKEVWSEDILLFEADLLIGLDYFLKRDYYNAEKYFIRLNKISEYNFFFNDFVGNILLAWSRAAENKQDESLDFLKKIPKSYNHLTRIQNAFLGCYFNDQETLKNFKEIINDNNYNFSRYNFFLINYLVHNNSLKDIDNILQEGRKENYSNLLIKQTERFFYNKENQKIKNFFNCKNPKDPLAEFFYILSNLYASEKSYQLSNFYLKISLFLNNKFLTNKALLAENFYYQDKKLLSKKIYESIKSIGEVYFWHASKSIATILIDEKGKKHSINSLEKDFNLLSNQNFEDNYELANFYKDNEFYKKSIKYYSIALEKINNDHFLVPKILYRRGSSYERIGEWEKAESDFLKSLEIEPDQAEVLNYLAYSWIDKGVNIEEGLEMLKKAISLREDGYIIDSLGWAYYAKEDYNEAKKFLQKAVELLPNDPIINDHYADSLWMTKNIIQARYLWNAVLKMENIEEDLKEKIKHKLIFGITKKI